MDTTFSIEASFPPSLAGLPVLAMLTQMGFWAVVLLCLQWIYSILDDAHDHPAKRGTFVYVSRGVKLRLLIATLVLALPRLILLVAWQRLSPNAREIISLMSWVILIPVSVTLAVAWWRDRRIRPVDRQIAARKIYIEITPAGRGEKTRGVIGLGLIFVIAFATTFVRLDPGHVATRHIPVEHR